jgi:outer membrane lipoprotein LolB
MNQTAVRWGRLAAALALAALVSACASPGTRVSGAGEPAGALDAWKAAGRLGVAARGQGGSASFLWQQVGEQSVIRLSGPVGIGSVEIEVDAADLRVATSDGQVFESEAAHRELAARLGADVPTSSLRYWLLGLAAPGPHRWSATSDGRRVLEQDGWRIEYGEFTHSGRTELPTRLTATAGETRVRLVIDRWDLAAP